MHWEVTAIRGGASFQGDSLEPERGGGGTTFANVPNATELYTLGGFILCDVNSTSIN